jgi:hypothetical protein
MQLEAQELLDISRAMEASLAPDDADDSPGEASPPPLSSSSSSEEEEKEHAPVWSTDTADVRMPAFEAPSGKQHEARRVQSPLSFLQLFLPVELMQQLAAHTTAYAHTRGAAAGWETNASELYAFLGVHIFMGICPLPQWHMYWCAEFQQPFVAAAFRRDRFEQLLRFFHVAPPHDAAATHDPFSRVRPLIRSLQQSFARMYSPTQPLTVDECIVGFKGRHESKQYIKSKPTRWGYKVWCLANDGYLLAFQVYEGKEEVRSPEGQAHRVVIELTRLYHGAPHVVYLDNYFTSPAVLDALQRRGMRGCGTVQRRRREMPVLDAAAIDALQRGEYISRQRGDLSLVVWRDRRPVWVLSNHCSPKETASLQRSGAAGAMVAVPCPRAVRDYNFHRGEVDRVDQLHAGYLIGRKSKKSWPRLAWWLLDMCILNAFKLWAIGKQGFRQLDFRIQLMHALVKLLEADQQALQTSRGGNASIALAIEHFTVSTNSVSECAVCSNRPAQRKQTRYACAKCNTHLCMGPCFVRYHQSDEH